MAVSDAAWDGSASNYDTPADYAKACLINMNRGSQSNWTKALCKLPYKEPDGDINRNACHAAAAALAGGRTPLQVPPAFKKAAAKKLVSIYKNDLSEDPPPSLLSLAGE